MIGAPVVTAFFEPVTSTFSYVVADPASHRCAIVDSALDFDGRSGRTRTAAADRLAEHVRQEGLTVEWLLETHVHADHMSAAAYLAKTLGGRTGIGDRTPIVQRTFQAIYNLDGGFTPDGTQYDHLFGDGEEFSVGGIVGRTLSTPGHTPACVCYLLGDALFVGDAILMPDFGTARCDFPGGDPGRLYASLRRVLELPAATRMFVAHDYAPGGRALACETTVGEQRAANIHVREDIAEAEFVALRRARDATLELPLQMLAAIQVNIRGGRLPPPEANGTAYLKLPLNRF